MQQVATSFQLKTKSEIACDPSTTAPAKCDPTYAADRARLLFGCYRKGDANDPITYATAITAILAEYPPEVVQYVTDPRTGLPAKLKWLPAVAEVRDACEARCDYLALVERARRWQARLAATAEMRALPSPPPEPRPELPSPREIERRLAEAALKARFGSGAVDAIPSHAKLGGYRG